MNGTNIEADVQIKNENEHDHDVDRARSFEGQLNRFLHQTNTTVTGKATPVVQRRIITRSQSITSIDSTQSPSPLPSKTPTLTIQEYNRSPIRKPKSRKTSSKSTATTTTTTTTIYSPPSRLRDSITPNLILLLIGVNPGLLTGSTGYAYAHPSNLFWKLLHSSGITTIRHPPSDTYRLPELYNIGNTNIVERPTRDASMLSKAEMNAGVPILESKIASSRPEAVALVGKSIWESVWRVRHGRAIKKEEFRYGWQDDSENMGKCEGWNGARVFVATTTSGLAATMSLEEKQEEPDM
ncbi:mismatch-specific thymine-DNA glycosylase, putative [Talaromyces stipitatus ATCC 10500]|uniref:Mismatch-specific thymine-DNA glycosylase, putative n=1 Tax=Talaromyces stipitatus (strain ATCC 10500 / CBS 375.48 / QM 6759 / NRRL 1006) TaxID=441959 RepID=B8LZ41_TALSN|nr:mismatch-specific thymine-DNA glycosylase, putative [Talaromyces stipitatus ATCC 10500]EED21085.1 mismatch-specific thymine-DNA glycosylase, putative [Talaromyces stipitatus ATCC 10500]